MCMLCCTYRYIYIYTYIIYIYILYIYIYIHRHVYIYSSTNWIISGWAPLSQPRQLNTFRLCLHVARCCTHVPDFTSIPFFHWLMIFLHCGRPDIGSKILLTRPPFLMLSRCYRCQQLTVIFASNPCPMPHKRSPWEFPTQGLDMWPPWNLE